MPQDAAFRPTSCARCSAGPKFRIFLAGGRTEIDDQCGPSPCRHPEIFDRRFEPPRGNSRPLSSRMQRARRRSKRRFKSCQPDRCLALSKAHWSRMDAPRISIASLSLLLVPLEGGQVRSTNTLSQSCVIHRPLGVSVASHRAGLGQAPGRVFRASFVDGARICAIRRFGLVCARRRHRCHLRVALAFMAIGGPVQL